MEWVLLPEDFRPLFWRDARLDEFPAIGIQVRERLLQEFPPAIVRPKLCLGDVEVERVGDA